MSKNISKLERSRQKGENQVDEQRDNILDTAERLFLEQGLEQTHMSAIAKAADINRVSLYRYFPDRHPIAFEIAVRMMKRIVNVTDLKANGESNLEQYRKAMLAQIDHFHEVQDAHRYLGMFDNLYGASYPDEDLAEWYSEQLSLFTLDMGMDDVESGTSDITPAQIVMIANTINSFLQKMAVRGVLLEQEQGIPVDKQLEQFRQMINLYFDHLATQQHQDKF